MAKEQLTELAYGDKSQILRMFKYDGTRLVQEETGVRIIYTTNVPNNDYDYSCVNFEMNVTYLYNNTYYYMILHLYRDKNNGLIQYGNPINIACDSAPYIYFKATTYYNNEFRDIGDSVVIPATQ